MDLEIPEKDDDEKETKSKGARKDSVLNASPLGAGLRDGAVLAFKFRRDDEDGGDWDVVMPIYEEEEDEVWNKIYDFIPLEHWWLHVKIT